MKNGKYTINYLAEIAKNRPRGLLKLDFTKSTMIRAKCPKYKIVEFVAGEDEIAHLLNVIHVYNSKYLCD